MDPAQSSSTEAPAQDSSPYQPRHDGAEPTTQPTLPSRSTLRTGAPDPELPISSPTSTRPHPSLVAEAGPSSAPSLAMEVNDTVPGNVRAGKDQYVDRGSSTQAATTEELRHRSNVHHHHHHHGRERLAKNNPAGAANEPTGAEHERKQRRDQRRNVRRARKSRERRRRRHALGGGVDGITDRLSAVRTDEPPERNNNVRDENLRRLRCENRAAEAPSCRAAPEYSAAGRAEQMRAVERRIQRGAAAAGASVGGGEGGEWEAKMDILRRHDLM
ncbi:MAG: hypothetical protein ALECFALPRED_008177 [Alectoria fallacina]|uniref:Uncharacterized protein n=1 Tax=Alectoria fallacina TaxID=1903189 RepID=A0A8H3J2L9_9LECA|nr:MAG: hypothetical protein ALECFALPRED_008177 [Alectoria fallacina]